MNKYEIEFQATKYNFFIKMIIIYAKISEIYYNI